MGTPLDLHVKALLDAKKGDWQAVAEGSGVSYSWISKFYNGHIDNPGFGTLTKLAVYLEAAQAPVKVSAVVAEAIAADHPVACDDPELIGAACLLGGEPRGDGPREHIFNKQRRSDKPNASGRER